MVHTLKVIGFLCLSGLGLVLSSSVSGAEGSNLFIPDINLVLLVALALYPGGLLGLYSAFALGLLVDSASGVYLGISSFSFVVTWLLVRSLTQKIFTDESLALAFLCFAAALIKGFLVISLFYLYLDYEVFRVSILRTILIQAVFTACSAPLIFMLLEKIGFEFVSSTSGSKLSDGGASPSGKSWGGKIGGARPSFFTPKSRSLRPYSGAPKGYRAPGGFLGRGLFGRKSSRAMRPAGVRAKRGVLGRIFSR